MKTDTESRLSTKQKRFFTLLSFFLVIIFTLLAALFIGKPMIEFVREPQKFREFVNGHGILSDIVFIFMVVFQVIIAIVPGEPFEIAAGYAFGVLRGSIDCMIGFALGSSIIFFVVRKFGVRVVEAVFPIEKIRELKFLQNTKRLSILTFIIFLIPGTPKDLISYFIGLTDMRFGVWLFIATVARIPSLITSVLGGSALGKQRYEIAIIVFLLSLIVSGIGILIYNKISRKHKH